MTNRMRLKVKQLDQLCSFELTWGDGKELPCELGYPSSLTPKYKKWSEAFLNFYNLGLRGEALEDFDADLPKSYWNSQLVKAEAELRFAFQEWLRTPKLHDIRKQIIETAKEAVSQDYGAVDLFLTCYSDELARLPWESWEICEEANPGRIRIARTSPSIRYENIRTHRKKTRILVIVGHDQALNFRKDLNVVKQAIESKGLAEVVPLYCESEQDNLVTKIIDKIAEKSGWDMLVFAGHSSETLFTGGEIGVAPGISLSIQDIKNSLLSAQKEGLQFALFNSCNGLKIAESLIDFGLSQVIVMREPIHNNVALQFLEIFLRSLTNLDGSGEFRNANDAFSDACQHLLSQQSTYPSAYLIPSLFRHPNSQPFRLKRSGILPLIAKWLPTKWETAILLTTLLLSRMIPIGDGLLDKRTWFQAYYRDITRQVDDREEPSVHVISIDQESLKKGGIQQPNPIDREYLAQIVERLINIKVKVIGIDYLLSDKAARKTKAVLSKEKKLENTVKNSFKTYSPWFVFAAIEEQRYRVSDRIAGSAWTLRGDASFFQGFIELPTKKDVSDSNEVYKKGNEDCSQTCPFAYLLALSHILSQKSPPGLPQPKVSAYEGDFQERLSQYINKHKGDNRWISSLKRTYTPMGFPSIVDFSVPPDQAYDLTPAWKLLDPSQTEQGFRDKIKGQVVLIASGGYKEADDNLPAPSAYEYWCHARDKPICSATFPGGEAHAYMVHHFLQPRQRVILIYDFLLILLVATSSKIVTLLLQEQKFKRRQHLFWVLVAVTFSSLALFLQLYVSTSLLLPWLLPSVVLWGYFSPILIRKHYE